MPEDAVKRLNAEVLAGLTLPMIVVSLADTGYESVGATPNVFRKLARVESARADGMIKALRASCLSACPTVSAGASANGRAVAWTGPRAVDTGHLIARSACGRSFNAKGRQ